MSIFIHNTIFTGKFLIHLDKVDSTNNYAKEWIAKNKPIDGTVIFADDQYAGRGQTDNMWVSSPGKNLAFSLIYQTGFLQATQQFYLNMAVSLGVIHGLSLFLSQENLKIKWPNDVFCDNKKVGGILIENTITGTFLKNSIIGIGLNINQENFPENLPNASSLKIIEGKDHDLEKVLENILRSIESQFLLLKNLRFKEIRAEYIDWLFRLDESSSFRVKGMTKEGMIKEVTEEGKLVISFSGAEQSFAFKEVEMIV